MKFGRKWKEKKDKKCFELTERGFEIPLKISEIKSKQPSKIFPTFIFFLSAVEPTNGETKWRNRNDLQIDSVHASGDCCWDIEDNDNDYEIVDPGNPSLTNFDIAIVKVYNSCN